MVLIFVHRCIASSKNSTDGEVEAFYVRNAEASPRKRGDLVIVIHHNPRSASDAASTYERKLISASVL